ncbi:tRNA (guanosine-2'-O-)-methyltransferase [Marchantia polymorpha subsp. ruderalis]|uniref:tRNA/rRNA methyltransferase SpoU type domain-containing protein n=2 Tax=Marchantia polymorpha TaxID=3197 RepID=A0AAF6BVB2_MARPO|nr:hypothetical protein MARPO_0088s0068 [Marchantia polymorpha]BBN15946.1 hypothetical protein Mp_7g02190 [Marchantia polymorpha subsp. ruderalis]|eukprot:PTQ33526.1 hypothetical protein MARPO_0088s0068 [Marchantia polymorpha]
MALTSNVTISRSMRSASTFLLPGFFPREAMALRWPVSRSSIGAASIFDSMRLYRAGKTGRALEMGGNIGLVCRAEEKRRVENFVPAIKTAPVKTRVLEFGLKARTLGTNGDLTSSREGEIESEKRKTWFPHSGAFKINEEGTTLSTEEVLEMLGEYMMDDRKQRIEKVVANRTYSVSVVVEGLSDVGNVSAVCRTADALGFQSVHVIANRRNMRYRENPRTSMGAEKWLDVEKWDSTAPCLEALKARGYRIAVTHIADDTVSIHDMDWTIPTAVVLGNEIRGITEEAIALSDVRCCIPMAGMVESFNVSVAAAIVMHQAATDRLRRLGLHGDLSEEEKRILAADFFMRHRDSSQSILETLVARRKKRSRNRLKPETISEAELES